MTIADQRPDIDLYDPVHRHPLPDGGHFFALTRDDDVRAVGKDATTVSSEPTIMIDEPDPSTDMGDHKMMLMADPPLHSRMRRMVSRDLKPAAALPLDALLRQVLTRLDLQPAGGEQWLASNFINGPTHLPVTFRPGPRLGR